MTKKQRRVRVAIGGALAVVLALVSGLLISDIGRPASSGGGQAVHVIQSARCVALDVEQEAGLCNGQVASTTPAAASPTPTSNPASPKPRNSPPRPRATGNPPLASSGVDTAHVIRSINIGEYGCGDPFESDATLQRIASSHHIPYIRAPFRDGCTDAQYLEMLNTIVRVGAVPQVTIHGNCLNNASQQAEGDHWLSLLDKAVTRGVYWVEYGNEEDATCGPSGPITKEQYLAGWNRDIPFYRARHPRARFIGPVTAGHNTGWINYLLASGVPHPDAISWHWYPCGNGATDSQCLANTADIDNDVAQTDTYERQVAVRAPIWLTEWDMDYTSDARFGNQAYIQNWTALALQHLAHLHTAANLAVAEFYVLTNGNPNSDSDLCHPPPSDALTYIGAAFFAGLPAR